MEQSIEVDPITVLYRETPTEDEVIEAMAVWFALHPTGLHREKLGKLLAAFGRFGVQYPEQWECALAEE